MSIALPVLLSTVHLALLLHFENSQLETVFVCLRLALICKDFKFENQQQLFYDSLKVYYCHARIINIGFLIVSLHHGQNSIFKLEVLMFVIDLAVVITALWSINKGLSSDLLKSEDSLRN